MNFRKRIKAFMVPALLILGAVFPVSAAERSIAISGVVVDSATNQPLPQAMIVFYAASAIDSSIFTNMLGNFKLDTAFSGADGKYSYSMKISSNALVLIYAVIKPGYQLSYAFSTSIILSSTVVLPTIKLQKSDQSAKDTLTVTGTVVDSATGNPIGNCLIMMSGLGGLDTTGNTAVSGLGGSFSKQVIIGTSVAGILGYVAVKDLYIPAIGQKSYSGKQVDLGTIKMRKINAAIRTGGRRVFTAPLAETMDVYSVQGRTLYSGRPHELEKAVRPLSGAAVVRLTKSGKCLQTGNKIVLR